MGPGAARTPSPGPGAHGRLMANRPGTERGGGAGKGARNRICPGRVLGAAYGSCPLRQALPTAPTPPHLPPHPALRSHSGDISFFSHLKAGRATPQPPPFLPIPIQPPQWQAALSGGGEGGHRAVLCPSSTVTLCPALPRGPRGNLPRCRLQLRQI